MANSQKRLERGVLIGLIAILSLAGGLVFMTSGGGSATAQAQPAQDIIQVTPEEGRHKWPSLVEIAATGRLLLVYRSNGSEQRPDGLYQRNSDDGGQTWSPPTVVVEDGSVRLADLIEAADGTVWLVYDRWQDDNRGIFFRSSHDRGVTWSPEGVVVHDTSNNKFGPAVVETNTGRKIVAWEHRTEAAWTVDYAYTDNDGATWDGPFRLAGPSSADHRMILPDLTAGPGGEIWAVVDRWNPDDPTDRRIYLLTSAGDGATWSAPVFLDDGAHPSIASTSAGLTVSWIKRVPATEPLPLPDWNVWYMSSADAGTTWTPPAQLTVFQGYEQLPSVASLEAGGFAIAWESNRRRSSPDHIPERTIWFGNPALHGDSTPPPAIQGPERSPSRDPVAGAEWTLRARVAGDLATAPVVQWEKNGVPQQAVPMEMESSTGSTSPVSAVYGASLGVFDEPGVDGEYRILAEETNGSTMTSFSEGFRVQPRFAKHNDVLLVVDHADEGALIEFAPFYSDALEAAGVGHDLWDSSLHGPPMAEDLLQYRHGAVVWTTPYYDSLLWQGEMPDRAVEALIAYLDGGGSMFISSQELSQHFEGEEWVARLLGVEYVDCCSPNDVEGVPGDLIGDGLAFGLEGGSGAGNSCCADEIRPVGGAVPAFRYLGGGIDEDGVAAVRSRRGSSRVVYFGFAFESINNREARNEVMARVMDWINPTCNGLPSTIDGTGEAETIIGTREDDVIVSFGGRDRIWGLEGDDTICGGAGKDVIFGGEGNDWIAGLGGPDRINAGSGRDVIKGGRGEDLIIGGQGDDVIEGGPRDDQVSGGDGDDFIDGGFGDDLLLGDDGQDIIEGGPGVDAIDCGDGADIADGGRGRDAPPIDCELRASIP